MHHMRELQSFWVSKVVGM